ncbi:MAG: UDP-N-acetyl-D-glucosamine dehydrogenase [Ilumatobacter sp.]|jgi:UDP-N-acetyl-D-glucosamine dehydrogenase
MLRPVTEQLKNETTTQKILVVGQGYVGLPLAMRAVQAGYDVVGFDIAVDRIETLRRGDSHIADVAPQEITDALATGRYVAESDAAALGGFDFAVITVPTPLADGIPDLTAIDDAAALLGPLVRPGCTVILESTTYPGTTDERLAPALEAVSGFTAGIDFHVGYSPERIDPGNKEWTLTRTPKVVSGLTSECLTVVTEFYDRIVDTTVPVATTRIAELTKLLENTFRHVNIALVNELAVHARGLGVDIWSAIDAAATKPFGFTPFRPGPGVGGHCLPIDPSYLSWRIERELGVTSRFVVAANDINSHMPDYVIKRVQAGLNNRRKAVNGSRVLVLGIAYKKNTNDARETPAEPIVRGLADLGATVVVHDDHVGAHALDRVADRVPLDQAEVERCDAIVLVTDHDDVDYALVERHASYVFDSRNRLSGDNIDVL